MSMKSFKIANTSTDGETIIKVLKKEAVKAGIHPDLVNSYALGYIAARLATKNREMAK